MSLDRVVIPDNVLDRLDALENRLAELTADSITPQTAANAADDAASVLSGWVIDGGVLRDAAGLIVLDPSIPGIQITAGGRIYSSDFVAGTSGFNINGGTAEFNDVVIRGTIYASVGEIGGWTIGATSLTGGDATLDSSGYLLLGTGDDVARIDASDALYRLWIGDAAAVDAPFSVTKAGALLASNASITGAIDANSGHIGNLDVDGVLTVGTVAPYIQIDGPNKRIRTSTYAEGTEGFTIEQDGDAEFNNIIARGVFRSSVFSYGEVHATGGSALILTASVLQDAVTTV